MFLFRTLPRQVKHVLHPQGAPGPQPRVPQGSTHGNCGCTPSGPLGQVQGLRNFGSGASSSAAPPGPGQEGQDDKEWRRQFHYQCCLLRCLSQALNYGVLATVGFNVVLWNRHRHPDPYLGRDSGFRDFPNCRNVGANFCPPYVARALLEASYSVHPKSLLAALPQSHSPHAPRPEHHAEPTPLPTRELFGRRELWEEDQVECPTSRFLHEIEKSEFDGSVGPSEGTTSASEDEEEVSSSAEEIPEVPSTTEDSLDSITEELARTHHRLQMRMEANLGLDLILTGQPDKVAPGLSLLESAARSGDSEALHNLGVVYEQGMTGIPKNLRKATKLYRRAAKLGYAASMYNLGLFYEQGLGGLRRDGTKAALLFARAEALEREMASSSEENGLPECDHCDRAGWNAKDNSPEASPNRVRANPRAVYLSGRQYHYGLGGLTQDKVHALELYRTAMKHGLSEATEAFEELQQELLMEAKEADSLQKKNPQETESCAKMMEPASTHTKTGRSLLEQEFKKFERSRNQKSQSLKRLDSNDSGLEERITDHSNLAADLHNELSVALAV